MDFSKGEIYSILGEGEKGIQSLKNNKISSYSPVPYLQFQKVDKNYVQNWSIIASLNKL